MGTTKLADAALIDDITGLRACNAVLTAEARAASPCGQPARSARWGGHTSDSLARLENNTCGHGETKTPTLTVVFRLCAPCRGRLSDAFREGKQRQRRSALDCRVQRSDYSPARRQLAPSPTGWPRASPQTQTDLREQSLAQTSRTGPGCVVTFTGKRRARAYEDTPMVTCVGKPTAGKGHTALTAAT
jgi:hypothetical protein